MNRKWRTNVVRAIAGFAVAVMVALAGLATLHAQNKGQNNQNNTPGKVTGSPFDAIQATLDQILAVLTPAAPGPVTLATPLVLPGSNDLVFCTLTNVGAAPLALVTRRYLNREGVEVFSRTDPAPPGASLVNGRADREFIRCEFTFVGSPANVRAGLFLEDDNGTRVSVDAR